MSPAPRDVPPASSGPQTSPGTAGSTSTAADGTLAQGTVGTVDHSREHLDHAMRAWQRTLVEAGGPNTLLWFEDVPGGTLDLTTAHPGGVSMLMAGRATRLSDLVREPSAFAEARRRAEGIRDKTVELAQERGLTTGFMAIGMASWTVSGARRSPQAPVLLRGCSLHPTDPTHRDYDIDLSPAVELNPVLLHYLASEQGIDVDAEAVAALAHSARRFDPLPVFRELTRLCRSVANFRVADRKVVAPFSYAKLPLIADLISHGGDYADNRLVALLAGAQEDADIGAFLRSAAPAAPAGEAPGPSESLVLPADAEQRRAVAAVRGGHDVAIDAASGTGRTQTLANLIAGLIGDGKRVLVVSQNTSALKELHARLADVGLAEAAVHVGEGGLDRGRLARAVRDVIDAGGALGREPDEAEAQDRLARRRVHLDAHRDAQHEQRDPWGVTVFEGLSALARLTRPRRPPTSRVRLAGDVLARLDRQVAARASTLLTRAAAAGAWSEDRSKDPWAHARIIDEPTRERALDLVQELSARRLEEDGAILDAILVASGLPAAGVPADWARGLTLLDGVRTTM
ncbi:MAG: UvrD-helicase domain-containing protein, partial [Micrococcales bacterium]|nr:UvrD-helicase domain-containing protein [Micrococcales bacterium]